MRCAACDAEIGTGVRFCPQCGAAVASVQTPPPDPLRSALEAAIGFQYRIVRLLGRGGMGAVYLAHELALERDVAIKVLPPERSEGKEMLERFRREARTAARLTHPNIVPLLTFGEVHGLVYFVMAYVRGEPLSAQLRRAGRLPFESTRRILAEVAGALDYAHRQGIVHRDIKPDNVLIEEDSGRPLLADFGIAKAQGTGQTLTSTGAILGTPHYMSPEQAAGKADVDGRSDVYSLGVMGYEMLSGRRPFEGKTAGEVLAQHMTQEPAPLRALASGAPTSLVAAVTRCLAKDPAARWPDAKALAETLAADAEESDLPKPLENVSTAMQLFVLGCLIAGAARLVEWASPGEAVGILHALRRGPPLLGSLILFVAVLNAIEKGHSWRNLPRAALSQPRWWWSWYPPPLRRTGDVWSRLPGPIRSWRALTGLLALCGIFVLGPTIALMGRTAAEYQRTGSPASRAAMRRAFGWNVGLTVGKFRLPAAPVLILLVALGVGVEALRARRRARRLLGPTFDPDTFWELLLRSTANRRFWSQRKLAPLLAPAEPSPAFKEPTSARDLQAAITQIAAQLPAPLRETAQRAVAAARLLSESLVLLESELRELENEEDPAEAQRLADKLGALGVPRDNEPAERRQRRELLAKQAELMRGVAARLDAVRRERSRRLEQLTSLWRHAAALDGQDAAAAAARLRALCEEIERRGTETPTAAMADPDVADLPTVAKSS